MAGVCERPRWPGVAIPVEVTRMAPRHLLIALALLGCRVDPGAQSSTPPAGEDTILIAGHALYVPSGFNVNLFAEGLGGVRSLALGPGGAVFATLSGTIVRLVDADGDGIAESRGTVLSGLDYPFGLAFRRDTMYFSEQTTVRRLDPGARTPEPSAGRQPPPRAPEHPPGRQVVRLAAMLPPGQAEPGMPGRRLLHGRAAGDHGHGPLGAARARVLHWHDVPGGVPGRCVHDVSRLLEPVRPDRRESGARARAERPAHRDRGLRDRLAARRRLALGPPGGAARDAGRRAARE